MADLGLDVAVAGGIDLDVLPLFKDVSLYGIVIGRGITGQADPAAAALSIANLVKKIWAA